MKHPTKREFDRELAVFGKNSTKANLARAVNGGWDIDSIALGFALGRGCESEAFAVVDALRGREVDE